MNSLQPKSLEKLETTQTVQTPEKADSPIVLQFGLTETVITLALAILSFAAAWGSLRNSVRSIKETLKDEIKPDLKDVRERFISVETKVETMWKDKYAPASSPRKLNERGESILETSGIKEILTTKEEKILESVKIQKPTNAYDAEKMINQAVMSLQELCPDIVNDLKDGAFKSGADIDAVLFVGSVYLRDILFPKLGFKVEDLDA